MVLSGAITASCQPINPRYHMRSFSIAQKWRICEVAKLAPGNQVAALTMVAYR